MSLKIADNWFERKKIDDQITLLWEPNVHPFLRCNIWHIPGRDRDLLIDTGMGLSSLHDAAKDLFQKELTVVVTHTHMDHSGGAFEFDCCHVHPAEAESLRLAKDTLPLETKYWPEDVLEVLRNDGPIGDYVINALPSASFVPGDNRLDPVACVKLLDEGDIVDLGDRSFEVLHLPGHSPGSIGLWEANTGTLFSGDAVYDAQLLDELPGSDKTVYRQTMKRLLEMPVTVVHAGHEGSFGYERLREITGAYLEGRKLDYSW